MRMSDLISVNARTDSGIAKKHWDRRTARAKPYEHLLDLARDKNVTDERLEFDVPLYLQDLVGVHPLSLEKVYDALELQELSRQEERKAAYLSAGVYVPSETCIPLYRPSRTRLQRLMRERLCSGPARRVSLACCGAKMIPHSCASVVAS